MGINLMKDRVADDLAAEFTIKYSTNALREMSKELIVMNLVDIEKDKIIDHLSKHDAGAGFYRRNTSHLYPSSPKYKKPLADPICDTWIATGREG